MDKITLRIPKSITWSDAQLLALCESNRHLRIELDSEQNLTVMSPTRSKTGKLCADLLILLGIWNRANGKGYLFDSSSGFRLMDGSVKSPDISFIAKERWDELPEKDKDSFAPLCPDFVLELRSATDSKKELKHKMDNYMLNGCLLAWLVDPVEQEVLVYQKGSLIQTIPISRNDVLFGGGVLPGFALQLGELLA